MTPPSTCIFKISLPFPSPATGVGGLVVENNFKAFAPEVPGDDPNATEDDVPVELDVTFKNPEPLSTLMVAPRAVKSAAMVPKATTTAAEVALRPVGKFISVGVPPSIVTLITSAPPVKL